MMEKDEETPVAKSKEDLNKGELASLMAKIVELEQEITKLNAENGEVSNIICIDLLQLEMSSYGLIFCTDTFTGIALRRSGISFLFL